MHIHEKSYIVNRTISHLATIVTEQKKKKHL